MLKFMRKHANAWFIKVMMGMIVVTFVGFFGWNAAQGPFTRDVVATVDGEPLSLSEYQAAYRQTYDLVRRMYGGALDKAALNRLQLGRQAIETIIRSRLQSRQARLAGISISNEEVARHIQSRPAFQRNGRFDRPLYLEILRRNRVPVAAYEEEQREILLLRRMESIIRDSVKVTGPEVEDAYRWSREGVKVRYLIFPPDRLEKEVEVKEDDLRAFFDREKERFRVPKKVQAAYLFADIQSFERSVKVTEEGVAQAYEARKEEFREVARRKAQHILIKVRPEAKPDDVAKAKNKAEGLLRRLRDGEDFAALAKKFSDDPNAADGGNLGAIARGELDPAFEKALFAMKTGEMKGPVKTPFGFHIVRLDAIEPERLRPLSEVKASLMDGLRTARAAADARDAIEKFWVEVSEGRAFDSFPQTAGIKRGVSKFFSADGKGLPVPDFRKVAAAALQLAKGELSDPIEGDSGWYVVRVTAERASRIPDLKEVRKEARKAYVQRQSERLAEERSKGWVKSLDGGGRLREIAKREGLKVSETPFFTRIRPLASPQAGGEFYGKIFGLKVGRAGQAAAQGGRMLFVVTGRKVADLAELKKDDGRFRAQYLQGKQGLVLRSWANALRRSAEVEIRPGMNL